MNLLAFFTLGSCIAAFLNGIGMIILYLRYIRQAHNVFMTLRTTKGGEVLVDDLLSGEIKKY